MRRLNRNIALAVVVCVGATALLLTGVAHADVQIIDAGGPCPRTDAGAVKGKLNINMPGVPSNQCPSDPPTGFRPVTFGPILKQYCIDSGNPDNYCAAFGGWDNGACKQWDTCYPHGNAKAGGLGTSALPDSVIASVGLYVPGGGTNLETCDSCRIYVNTNRSVGGQVTLSISGGGLMINAVGPNQGNFAKYRVIVYPDSNVANADPSREGFGSVFFGEVVLQGGAVDGNIVNTAPVRSTRGGFTDSDWIFQTNVGGPNKAVSRPNGTLSKLVGGVNANTATVVTFADAGSFKRQAVPGYSPFGLVLLALGLLGSGFWVIRSRQRIETTA